MAEGRLIQAQTLVNAAQCLGLSWVIGCQQNQLVPGIGGQRADVALLHRAARHTRHQRGRKKVQRHIQRWVENFCRVQDVGVYHPAAARVNDVFRVRRAVENAPPSHVKQLNALVPVPGGDVRLVEPPVNMAGNMRELRRVAGQIFFPTVRVHLNCGDRAHGDTFRVCA